MEKVLNFKNYINEELKNMFKPKTLESLNDKLDKQIEKYTELSMYATTTSIYKLSKLANNVLNIASILHDMDNLIKKEYQQYHTSNDKYIKIIKDVCKYLLDDYRNGKLPEKMHSNYTKGIELIEIISHSNMNQEEIKNKFGGEEERYKRRYK